MNTKTTLFLLVAVGVCGATLLIFKPDPARIQAARDQENKSETKTLDQALEQTLIKEKDLGDIVKVSCKLAAQPDEWVFEKSKVDGKDVWDIRKPIEARATSWQVDSIHRRLVELRYEVSYKVGAGGNGAGDKSGAGEMSLKDAGLEPPKAVVTVTDAAGKSATVELGKSASRSETYARLAGADRIVVAKVDADNVLKGTILDYRDPRLFDFKPEEVVRIEATSRVGEHEQTPVTYKLIRDSDGWAFEAPFSGKATDEIKNVLTAMSNARISKWKDNDAAKLPLYGLDKPAVSLTITVEKKVQVKKPKADADQDAAPEPQANDNAPQTTETVTETHLYALNVSRIGPIGEDTTLFARSGEESAVGTLPKTTTDKLVPNETKWRDMRVTSAAAGKANRITLTLAGISADLVKQGDAWVFGDASKPADADAIRDLLTCVSGLNAKAFTPIEGDGAAMGFKSPEMTVSLTIPGQDQPERLTVGAPSDNDLKRMYYVRRNDSTQVAKVRTEDIKALLRPVTDYRSRQVFAVAPGGRIEKVELEYDNPVDEGRVATTFERQSNAAVWGMTTPVQSGVHKERFDKLLTTLRTLRAKRFVSDDADLARFGLAQDPAARLSISYVNLPEPGTPKAVPPSDLKGIAPPMPGGADEDEDEDDSNDAPPGLPAPPGGGSIGGPRTGDSFVQDAKPKAPAVNQDEPPKSKSVETPAQPAPSAASQTPGEASPQPQVVNMIVGTADGKHYIKRVDAPAVYEIDDDFFDKLREEYHEPKVLDFSESQVKAFSVRNGKTTRAFEKRDGQWVLSAERDLPLDQKAVANLLVNLADLKTDRYIRYGADPAGYGLTEPEHEVAVTLDDGRELKLIVSGQNWAKDSAHRYPAARNGEKNVFLLGGDSLTRFDIKVETLEAKQ